MYRKKHGEYRIQNYPLGVLEHIPAGKGGLLYIETKPFEDMKDHFFSLYFFFNITTDLWLPNRTFHN